MAGWTPGCRQLRAARHAHTYANGLTKSNTDGNGDCDTNGYRNTHGYSNANGYSDGHSYSYSNARHAQVCADTETSSHTAAQTIAVFAKANIVAIGDR